MDKPTISPLPPAPNRSQSPAEFAARADDFATALPTFRDQTQVAIDYIDYQLNEVTSARTAAQTAATNAQNSASAAANSAANADTSFQDMQILAAAMQAAAGLPTMAGKAGHALVVNASANGVMWSAAPIGTNASGDRTVSTNDPSGGQNGDIWYQVIE